jgi:transcription-repair coupling factor (superfamily II helicase)
VLAYLQTGTNKARLKQTGKMFLLVVDNIKGIEVKLRFLQLMHKEVVGVSA